MRVIDTGIEPPQKARNRGSKYGFDKMSPGDSVLIHEAEMPRSGPTGIRALANVAFGAGNYATKLVIGGLRVWRLK